MPKPKKEKTILELIEDQEDLIAQSTDNLQKIKNKIQDDEDLDNDFVRYLP